MTSALSDEGMDTLLLVTLETLGLLTVWIVGGVMFYYYCDENWDLLYSFFFSVNVGLGVGYGQFMPTRDTTKYFTSFYCMLGTSIAMGGLALFFEALTTRAKAATFTSPTFCSCCQGKFRMKWDDVRLAILFLAYLAFVAVGVWIGFEYEGYTDFADALLFSVTNYTTSGLLCPKYTHNSLLSTTISLIVGIPLNGLFWGEIATRFFADVQRKAEEFHIHAAFGASDATHMHGDDEDSAPAAPATDSTPLTAPAGAERPGGFASGRRPSGLVGSGGYEEFLEKELLRSGLVSRVHLENVKRKWDMN